MLDTLKGIFEALKAIPEIIAFIKEAFKWIKSALGGDVKGYIKKAGEAFRELNEAKTKEERINAARKIQDLIAGL